jgi:hypothetical protein
MDVASAMVKVMVEVEVRAVAELATERELAVFIKAHREEIEGATARALERDFHGREPAVGWLVDDREVFLLGVNAAEPVAAGARA